MVGWSVVWLAGCVVSPPPSFGGDDTDTVETDSPDTQPTGGGVSVLLLDDGTSGPQVEAALQAAGHDVVRSVDYWQWDGTNPRARDVDVVVWLQGDTFADPLVDAADRGLVNFVQNGGGLIRTELGSYAATIAPALAIDDLLPVSFDDDRLADHSWKAVKRGHALLQGLPEVWDEPGSSALVRLVGDAEKVMATQGGDPLLVVSTEHGGTIVYVNHDMTGTTPTISAEILGLMANAVSFAAP
ncbi:MAG TPA: hypothetical protein PKA64_19605 [Myxococcota bacterium]|nr:hypothetical protein [Myxococcota bacterium]